MKNLKIFSITKSPNKNPSAGLVIIFFAIAVLGFADASFLTAKYYLGGPIPCAILNGCETVTTSKYASIIGIPVSLVGTVYYLFLAILSLIYLDLKNYKFMGIASRLTIIGLLASAWFVSIQVFVLDALCLYCLVSAGSSTLLFILGIYMINRYEE